jgi:hypothetical protein
MNLKKVCANMMLPSMIVHFLLTRIFHPLLVKPLVEHLCSHFVLTDSVEVVIFYVDIAHDYQKEALCILNYTQDESCEATYFGLLFHQTANTGHLEYN